MLLSQVFRRIRDGIMNVVDDFVPTARAEEIEVSLPRFPLYEGDSSRQPIKKFVTDSGIPYEVHGAFDMGFGEDYLDFENRRKQNLGNATTLTMKKALNNAFYINELNEQGAVSINSPVIPRRDRPGSSVEQRAIQIENEILNHYRTKVVPKYSNLSGDVVLAGGFYTDPDYRATIPEAGTGLKGGITNPRGWRDRYGRDHYETRIGAY